MKPLMLLLLLSASCFSQQPEHPASKGACKTAFAVAERSADNPDDPVAAISKPQNDWWEHKGAKKYPDLCLVFVHDADYLLVWEDRILKREVMGKSGEALNDPLKDGTGADTGLSASREEPHYIRYTVMQELGSVWIYKRGIGQDGKQVWQAIEYKDSVRDATGWIGTDMTVSGSPTRRAMESALKFIRKHP